jgi:protein TonB
VARQGLPRARPVTADQPEHPAVSPDQAARPAAADTTPAQGISGDWQRSVADWLATHKTYPEQARRTGAAGTVRLHFTVDRSGKVMDVMVLRGAGDAVLDDAAEALVRGASLPPFPPEMAQERVSVTVQLHYVLTR